MGQQEQLSKGESECIYRHLQMFVFRCWDKKENVPDACVGCNHYCSSDKHVLDPWPAFYRLANLANSSYSGREGAKEMNEKVIELGEKEQKDLFCVAWHVTNFIEDMKEKKVASFATPCETCKYQRECLKDDFDAYNHFEILTKLTGVKISPLVGFRSLVKRGLQGFLKENTGTTSNKTLEQRVAALEAQVQLQGHYSPVSVNKNTIHLGEK